MDQIASQAKKVLVVGLTGVMGSGKSSVAAVLERCGALVIDADILAREVVAPGGDGLKEIVGRFGRAVVQPDGTLNRKALAELVFKDSAALRDLESITHPKIAQLLDARLRKNASDATPRSIVVYVAPLLFESGVNLARFDLVVAVNADTERCIERVMQRDHCSREAAERRLQAQLSNQEKVRRADLVVDNLGAASDLQRASEDLYRELIIRWQRATQNNSR